jgi:para-nitrobenzyl esterase
MGSEMKMLSRNRCGRTVLANIGMIGCTLALAGHAMAAITDPVKLQTGMISGVPGRGSSLSVFKGIPYAAPPVGDLRWRAPQPPVAWQGVRKGDQFGSICPQPGAVPIWAGSMSEDCLFLNVWTGAANVSEKRPVMVWFYGSGWRNGAGSQSLYDGEALARKGVVVVTVNYRIGPLGFLATPELSKESGHNASGNFGLLDAVAALQWVKRNIAAFGGDPNQVTIAGQSAGSGIVGLLIFSPLGKGLFIRGVAESSALYSRDPDTGIWAQYCQPLKLAEAEGVNFSESHGAHSLKELRALTWQQLMTEAKDEKEPRFSAHPTLDGWVMPQTYAETYAKGLQMDVPFIGGTTADEHGPLPTTAFDILRVRRQSPAGAQAPVILSLQGLHDHAKQMFGAMAEEFLKLYPASTDHEAFEAYNLSARDHARVSGFLAALDRKQKAPKSPVYTFFWTHAPPGPQHDLRGAYHMSEVNYVFNSLAVTDSPWTDQDRRIGETVSSYWANFTLTGNPNGSGLPEWPAVEAKSPTVMELGDHFQPINIASSSERLDFWERFFQTQKAY